MLTDIKLGHVSEKVVVANDVSTVHFPKNGSLRREINRNSFEGCPLFTCT